MSKRREAERQGKGLEEDLGLGEAAGEQLWDLGAQMFESR